MELSTTNIERKTPEVARWYLFQIPRVCKDEADGQPAGTTQILSVVTRRVFENV
jgi:hypothetical protein